MRAVVSLLAGRRLRDSNVPFRLFRRELWEELAPLIGPTTLAPSIFVAVGAAVRGRRIVEVPSRICRARGGTSSLRAWRLVRFSLAGCVQLVAFRRALGRAPAAAPARRPESTGERRRPAAASRPALGALRAACARLGGRHRGASSRRSRSSPVLALALRLPLLAEKPLHHDESEHAWFAWKIVTGAGLRVRPGLPRAGPVLPDALVYLAAGVGDFTARVAPRADGHGRDAAAVLPPPPARHWTRRSSPRSILCLSPSFLYFSRFAREDIYVATVTLALLVAVFRFLDRPRPWHPSLVLGLLAVSFATKETTYITAFVGGTFFAAVVVRERWRARRCGRARCGTRRSCGTPRLGRAGRVDLGRRHVRDRLHAALHVVLHEPARPAGRARREHRLLALAAAGQPGQPAVVLLPRRAAGATSGRCSCSARSGSWSCSAGRRCSAASSSGCSCAASPSTPGPRSGCRGSILHPLLPLVPARRDRRRQALWRSRGGLVGEARAGRRAVGAVFAL